MNLFFRTLFLIVLISPFFSTQAKTVCVTNASAITVTILIASNVPGEENSIAFQSIDFSPGAQQTFEVNDGLKSFIVAAPVGHYDELKCRHVFFSDEGNSNTYLVRCDRERRIIIVERT